MITNFSKKYAERLPLQTTKRVVIVFVLVLVLTIFLISQGYKYLSKCSWKHGLGNATNEFDLCPIHPPNLLGQFSPNISQESLEVIEQQFKDVLHRGGYYRPKECIARDRVAIVVPCRGREEQIPILLRNLHPFLMRQQLEYQIFVIIQGPRYWFNKGALYNAAFTEAMKIKNWDCLIFHDIDMIPMDDRNLYDCPRVHPRHMGVDVDKFDYKLYVFALTSYQYRRLNGHSNSFWGVGGEDDDMVHRLNVAGYYVDRYLHQITRYRSLEHNGSTHNYDWKQDVEKAKGRYNIDGLNSLKYQIIEMEEKITFTKLLVDFVPEDLGMDSNKVEEPREKKNQADNQ